MSDEPTRQQFLEAQAEFQLPSLDLVQKDWHVVRAMQAIAGINAAPFRLIFAGGTCLARAHRLVFRMSEDVDFKIVPLSDHPVSNTQRRKQLGDLRERITAALQAADFIVEPGTRSRDANHYMAYQLRYPGAVSAGGHLRPTLQVELNFAQLRQDAVMLPMASFVAEAFKWPVEVPGLACASITETAAEKLVALTRRTAMELAGLARASDPNLVRHIYDLHAVRAHVDHAAVIDLAREVALADALEFGNQYPAYRDDVAGETRKALDALLTDPTFRARYDGFVAAMVYGEAVAFETAMTTVATLAAKAWPLHINNGIEQDAGE